MTALSNERMSFYESWARHQMSLASGFKAWKGGSCAINLVTGKVCPASAAGNLRIIGSFAETVDATAAEKLVDVNFDREFVARLWANSVASALVAADVGGLCYVEDDQTVCAVPVTGAIVAGRVWAVSTRGVLVEAMPDVGPLADVATLPAFAAGNLVVPNNPTSGAVHDVPTTAAVSTVTLPATAMEGTRVLFVADGVKNGHTVQYRDATGPTVLTTALLASKRHQVEAVFLAGKWTANAYTAP